MTETSDTITILGPLRMTLPYPPAFNHLYATFRGRRIKSREGRAYKKEFGIRCGGMTPISGPVIVHADFFRPQKSGDLDGRLKALLDSLTGLVWVDDRQVTEIHARRFEDKIYPRVEITIEAMP